MRLRRSVNAQAISGKVEVDVVDILRQIFGDFFERRQARCNDIEKVKRFVFKEPRHQAIKVRTIIE